MARGEEQVDAEKLYEGVDSEALHEKLAEIDPARAHDLHPNDRKRVVRSLDIYQKYGITHTELIKRRKVERENRGIKYNVLAFILQSDPEIHRTRINARVDEMLKNGILDELKELATLAKENPELNSRKGIFQSIAYKELMPILAGQDGNIVTHPSLDQLDQCKTTLENKTWRYAQRQKTWIKNRIAKNEDLKVEIVDVTDLDTWEQMMDKSADLVIDHLEAP